VLDRAGAVLPVRDAVDRRVVRQVASGSGRIINSQADVGGWTVYRTAEAPADADRDGMPDAWEKAHALNPVDPSDQNRQGDRTGYTNLETYLNEQAHRPRASDGGIMQKSLRKVIPEGFSISGFSEYVDRRQASRPTTRD
jgi:hypothetical protein